MIIQFWRLTRKRLITSAEHVTPIEQLRTNRLIRNATT